jgi:polyferredoxin
MLMRIRQISQFLFFLFFLFLFLLARFPYDSGWQSDLFLRASPLVGLTTLLAGRTLVPSLLLSFVILSLTIPFGRFFCGWICPLGSLIDVSDSLILRRRVKISEKESTRFRSWKFFILTAVLTALLFSMPWAWFFDPIVLLTRVMTTTIFPAIAYLLNAIFSFFFNVGVAEDQWYTLYNWTQKWLLPVNATAFRSSILIFLLFLIILLLGFFSQRFWCRNLCPLGALFGLFSRFRLTQRYVSTDCTRCGVCRRDCRMNAIEDDYTVSNSTECIECGECVSVCTPKAISYRLRLNKGDNRIDFSRRRFLQATTAGMVSLAVVKSSARSRDETGQVIRPPGSLPEEPFLDRCIRCLACVRICSSTGACLQPSLTESGWEGIWSPRALMRQGYCEYNCNLCGQICPTGAIARLGLEEKQKYKMGTAYFDHSRCIPWYRQEDCLVCEEHCPLPDKAIKFDVREARAADGRMHSVKFPFVREEVCSGCGICETRCPVIGKPGIFVTAAGEQRAALT